MKKIICIIIVIIMSLSASKNVFSAESLSTFQEIDLNKIDQERIDELMNEVLIKSKVPGASVVLVNGEETKYLSYGYADKENEIIPTQNTLFELGSMSKAFTALGILLLEDQGKLSLDDFVTDYIPWFSVRYKGIYDGERIDEEVELTIANLLYHTSGIPFKTIGYLPEGTSENMLQATVKTLVNTQLDFYPGDRYQYATINYDILGYIIQIISGQTYEDFMQEHVIDPLGLDNTYLFQKEARKSGLLAQGYKITFFDPQPYDAPRYRGNTPAGYIISSAKDMERWMRIQMGLIDVPVQYEEIIEKSHIGNTTVASQGNNYYAAGWEVNLKGKNILHDGNNPNYSSTLLMQPENKLGICILTNMNSNAVNYLANNILNIIQGKDISRYTLDLYKSLDTVFSIVIVGAVMLGLLFVFLLLKAFIELIKGERIRSKLKGAKVAGLLLAIPLMVFCGFCVYYLPNILLERLPWDAVNVWGASTIMAGCIVGYITFNIFMLYILLTFNFPKDNEKGYVALIPLSLINGIASSLIIFTINESFNRDLAYSKELLLYFVFALLFFVYTIKLLQGRMIVITNEITYEKRMNMIDKIMRASYQAIEGIGRERIFSGLNNDCAELAHVPTYTVSFASNLLTIIFCLLYLLSKSIYAFVASLGIILINGFISFITSRIAYKYWEENRNIQDTYFGQMQDLVNGFKELALNRLRRFAFWNDMKKYSRLSTELNKTASIKFLNFDLYNTLMYNIVFGVVVFLFPILFLDINTNQLRENLFIVFYMIGPFGAIAGTIPKLTQLNVNVKRINKLIDDLEEVSTGDITIEQEINTSYPKVITIQFKEVTYKYISKNKEGIKIEGDFTLGPITTEFKSNEIVFITGGNGSGKSTLGKLITGLYSPLSGRICINGKVAALKEQNELFSSVYTDFNLFKKLYGIDYVSKKEKILEYLELMKIHDKVEINGEGEFKTINLSTGQRKRLAFIVSCLEDKPMMIFDEWAAEQDPEFRQYFYDELLPMLKKQGKGVIVISHDDRYFDKADRLIKLERGMRVIDNY
ncbi:hypothetical protein acsn021_37590 [Anaerocolumna cellulosilytica]|uniref:Beta-lactamase n=1 Tax=Anaerocolumna cellulosilytica TaxID=433286 RepID=A0A6S6R9Q0_9FIRM|nr:cyclic peptide export ABC transporter [Anaerocolumna cellulosilytica]MBB5194974.1 cyclic peptide transporter [Anaerocolumna cellulosilytica]BCJ96190.1 hypothetical protein acsn021_37590 [Anaerocolumna cellulosilytica]